MISFLGAVRFLQAEDGFVGRHSSPVYAYFVGVWFSGSVQLDREKLHYVSHARYSSFGLTEKSVVSPKSMVLVPK